MLPSRRVMSSSRCRLKTRRSCGLQLANLNPGVGHVFHFELPTLRKMLAEAKGYSLISSNQCGVEKVAFYEKLNDMEFVEGDNSDGIWLRAVLERKDETVQAVSHNGDAAMPDDALTMLFNARRREICDAEGDAQVVQLARIHGQCECPGGGKMDRPRPRRVGKAGFPCTEKVRKEGEERAKRSQAGAERHSITGTGVSRKISTAPKRVERSCRRRLRSCQKTVEKQAALKAELKRESSERAAIEGKLKKMTDQHVSELQGAHSGTRT